MSQYLIYRYLYHGNVIYIGKSNNSIMSRVESHAKEEKFNPYLKDCKIEYFPLHNSAETAFWEPYLINKYQPILNFEMKFENSEFPELEIPKWYDISEMPEETAKWYKDKAIHPKCKTNVFYKHEKFTFYIRNCNTSFEHELFKTVIQKWLNNEQTDVFGFGRNLESQECMPMSYQEFNSLSQKYYGMPFNGKLEQKVLRKLIVDYIVPAKGIKIPWISEPFICRFERNKRDRHIYVITRFDNYVLHFKNYFDLDFAQLLRTYSKDKL